VTARPGALRRDGAKKGATMTGDSPSLDLVRRASLARLAHERARRGAPVDRSLEPLYRTASASGRSSTEDDLNALLPVSAAATDIAPPAAPAEPRGAVNDLMRQRAALELKLQTADARIRELETTQQAQENERRQAAEALALQQTRLAGLQEERAKLLAEVSELETRLRRQINQTEQVELQYEKLKAARGAMGQQATEHAEQLNALRAENEALRQELERARQERDVRVADVSARKDAAEARSEDSAFQDIWVAVQPQLPELFVATHVPTRATFTQVAESLVELTRTFTLLEQHVHHLLKDLRQVAQQNDPLNHFYGVLTRNPPLLATLRDFLISGKRKNNFTRLVRALSAWTMAFSTGLNKVIIRSPTLIASELNYRQWPLPKSMVLTEEARIGKYFRDVASKSVPDALGTAFKRHAAEMVHEDYNDLMRPR
jgi:hypothetical protein